MPIGRSHELHAVTAVLDRVGPGSAAVVLEGEAGIGKTTLLDAAVRRARARSFAVMACRPAQSEAALPCGALADLVRNLDREVLGDLPGPQRRALDAVRLDADPEGDEPARRAVGTALCSALEGVAARAPLLVVVDDVQWLDQPSEEALRFAARRMRGHPIAFVASVRSGGRAVDPLGLEAAHAGGASRVVVGGMSLPELRELLSRRLGVSVVRPLLVRIAEATGGNPFYALELTRALAARRKLEDPTVALPLPDRLQDLVADRIAALDPPAATACLVVAALAQPSVELVLAATDSPTWAASGAAAAEDAGIITLEGTAIRFTHPLLRSAVYDAARPSARRAVHARLAALVGDPAERARHLADSVAGSDSEVASALDPGARHAWDRGARNVAAELAERALALTPAADPRNQRRLVAAGYQYEAANPTRSRTLLGQVLDDDPTRVERLEAICRLGSVRYYEADFERSVELLSGALAELDEHEHRLRARLETELAYTLIARGDYGMAEDRGEAAIAAAQAAGDGALARAASAPLAWASLCAGHGVRAELVELCLSGSDLPEPFAVEPRMQAAAVLKWGDQLDRARSVLSDLYELARARTAVAKLPLLAWQIADLEVLAGRWELAERLADEAVEGSRFRAGMAVAMCTGLRARVHALRGRIEAARADVAEASAAARGLGGIAAMAATDAAVLLETCRGDPVGVHAVAGPLVADLDAIPPTDPAFLRWVPDEVEALVALGDETTAAEVLEWFEGRCRATGRRSGWAAAHRCRALLAGDSGAVDAAAEHVGVSVDLFAEVGMPFERARSLLVAGGLHRRARRRGPAAAALQEARATFDGLGARGWAERASAGLDRLGAVRTGYAESGKLTLSEAHVARLVAAGLRNREVAVKLFMSPKTVESHLTCIYRKLGVRSRTELAAALAHGEPSNGADLAAGRPGGAPDRPDRED